VQCHVNRALAVSRLGRLLDLGFLGRLESIQQILLFHDTLERLKRVGRYSLGLL
jgi:hypothetical protein